MYLVTTYFNGPPKIGDMRSFESKSDADDYATFLTLLRTKEIRAYHLKQPNCTPDKILGLIRNEIEYIRIWEIFSDYTKKPKKHTWTLNVKILTDELMKD